MTREFKDKYDDGMKVRRRILGESYVDASVANTTPLTQDFQDLLTRYGWGEVWTRPRFDYRTRRILVLGTMVGIGRWEEFKMHLRSALTDGMSIEDIKEILMQQAIYCGLPASNTAFHHVHEVIAELQANGIKIEGLES